MDAHRAPRRARLWIAGVLLLLIGGGFLAFRLTRGPTEHEVRGLVLGALRREAPQSFLVTGTLDVVIEHTLEDTKYVLGMNLGTTRSTVRVPGRVSYGFDVRELKPEMLAFDAQGVLSVRLPRLVIWSVEPELEALEVRTEAGWARMLSRSGRAVEQQAIRNLEGALRAQGEASLAASTKARANTSRAVVRVLDPVLGAAGLSHPTYRFQVGGEEVPLPPRG